MLLRREFDKWLRLNLGILCVPMCPSMSSDLAIDRRLQRPTKAHA